MKNKKKWGKVSLKRQAFSALLVTCKLYPQKRSFLLNHSYFIVLHLSRKTPESLKSFKGTLKVSKKSWESQEARP
jgi:hypothetical protein